MVIGFSPAIQRFIAHWRSLLKDGLVPTLTEFLNHPLPDLQPYVILLDVVSETEIPVRLLGTGLVQLTGREFTKTNALEIYAPHLRKRVGQTCMTIVRHPCGQITERLMNTAGGVTVATTGIALPLSTKSGAVNCIAAYNAPREPVAAGDSAIVISDIIMSEWVDIGAGLPKKG
ncbi:MAG: PAS domain-containing protein [Rhodospirillaceae bacterium]|nr:PAS domain-containing protein [Rhodospirillaceae bacterium]